MELADLDATAQAELVRARTVSPVELVDAHLERIAALDGGINAFVTLDAGARDAAAAAEQALLRGDPTGPLHGVPFSVKDSLDTAGVRTTRGSLLFGERVPDADATAVARIRGAGGILLGKTNLPEFALWWETDNRVAGRTVNPWDHTRTSGGSSGGEAAALAARLTPLGLGSDLGGSIRLPAAHCGVVGLKPTHGRVPLTGHWPESILRFMHVGPMARSVRDVALALAVLNGPDGDDWHAVPVAMPAPAEDVALADLRVAWCAETGFGPVQPAVAAAVRDAAAALAAAGATVVEIEPDWLERRDCNLLTMTLYGGEGRPFFGPITAGREEELHDFLRGRLGLPAPSYEDYVATEVEVEGLRKDLAALLRDHHALLCPTVAAVAPPHARPHLDVNGQELHPRTIMRATIPFDLTGSPALSVPFALNDEGLPVGVQVVGRRFDESRVFALGAALERARTPASFRPPGV